MHKNKINVSLSEYIKVHQPVQEDDFNVQLFPVLVQEVCEKVADRFKCDVTAENDVSASILCIYSSVLN